MIAYLLRSAACCIVLIFLPYGLFAQEGSEGQRLYQAFLDRPSGTTEVSIRKLKPAERQAVIDHVRYLQTLETAGKNYDNDTLFFMGEPTVRKNYFESLRKKMSSQPASGVPAGTK
jgi:hypothetical protein